MTRRDPGNDEAMRDQDTPASDSALGEVRVEEVPEPNGCLLLWAALGILFHKRSSLRIAPRPSTRGWPTRS